MSSPVVASRSSSRSARHSATRRACSAAPSACGSPEARDRDRLLGHGLAPGASACVRVVELDGEPPEHPRAGPSGGLGKRHGVAQTAGQFPRAPELGGGRCPRARLRVRRPEAEEKLQPARIVVVAEVRDGLLARFTEVQAFG
jgi:hypothetical protein